MTAYAHDIPVTTPATALWTIKSSAIVGTLSATNWVVTKSATGGIYAQSGDVITSESSLLSARAWWVMRGKGIIDGGTSYYQQICWQTNGSGGVRVKISPRAGFVGGSPSSTRVPSATDERVLIGAGTDADPEFTSLFPSSGSWLQARFSESDDSIWVLTYPVAGGVASGLFCVFCTPLVRDSVGVLIDSAPHAYYAASGANCALAQGGLASESTAPMGLLGFGESSGGTSLDAWCRLPAMQRTAYDSAGVLQQVVPGHLPQSPSYPSGALYAQDTLRLARRSERAGLVGPLETGNANTCGDKGEVYGVRYSGRRFTTPTLLSTVTPGGSSVSSAIGIGDLILPWEAGYALRDGA